MLRYGDLTILLSEDDVITFCLIDSDFDKEELGSRYAELMEYLDEGYFIVVKDKKVIPLEMGLPVPK